MLSVNISICIFFSNKVNPASNILGKKIFEETNGSRAHDVLGLYVQLYQRAL